MRLARERRPELMDAVDADAAELADGLEDLRSVNRWLGGRRSAVRLVMELAGRIPRRSVSVLDVGTGGADIPLALTAAARRAGRSLQVTGLDVHPATLEYARAATAADPDIAIVAGDARRLPFGDGSFDIVMSHTTLHHFDPSAAAVVLREMDRVAHWGVVVTDLSRSRLALLGAQLLSVTVWVRHPITRHDGPSSVRAAYTPEELVELARTALAPGFRVRREPGFRMSLVADRLVTARRGRAGPKR